ncbi:MAG: hypothetical protein ACK40M_14845 [Flavobacteriales bacterium]
MQYKRIFIFLFSALLLVSITSCRKRVPAQSGLIGTIAIGPCTFRIPAMAYVADKNAVANQGRNIIWVCGGKKLRENGGYSIIFLEPGAEIVSKGGGNTIYAKSGSKIDSRGGGDVIYYESGTNIVNLKGGSEQLVECPTLIFDYSLAPEKGCR